MHKGEVIIFSSMYIKMTIKNHEVNVDVQKGPPKV